MSAHDLTSRIDPAEVASTLSDGCLDRVLRMVLDSALDPVMIHRPDGTLVYWNEIAASTAGYADTDVTGLSPWAWTTSPVGDREERMHTLRREGALRFTCTNRKCNVDGERHVEVSSAWVETDDGPLIVAIERDVSVRTQAEQALRDMAFRDPLTGLANRAMLEDRLKLAVANARRHHDILGVLFIDLDDFKPVNDTYGHAVGDAVLRAVGSRMLEAVRAEDTVARVGGDEFVVVLPRLQDAEDLTHAAHKISAVIDAPFDLASGTFCCVSATIGHALFDHDQDDAHTLLIRADLAMYHARQAGEKDAEAEPLD